ncbi:MAG TPA: SpvB/TcaC N-terminal domain-containing protein, partial [Puia sp.]|nr:SpvB/TcaC N-terminal domain-containing protein [Puia sp.]
MENKSSYPFSDGPSSKENPGKKESGYSTLSAPQITLPKGGGAIKSIDDKFSVNAANGTAGYSIPFPLSPSRNAFTPSLTLNYNSGSGNGVFGLGWNAASSAISRKTAQQLPQYNDAGESDIFIFAGAEDLVPALHQDTAGNWIKDSSTTDGITITRYRPRIDGAFSRIEKITEPDGNVYWKVTNGNNAVSVFGRSRSAQIADPANPGHIFKWLFEFSYDDKGNCFQLGYKKEDKINVPELSHERNRLNDFSPCANTYLKRIKYANKSHFDPSAIDSVVSTSGQTWENFLAGIDYLLELVLDYGEHDSADPQPNDDKGWPCRTDPFSDYRAGFEIRTWRLCRRALMFHHFPELGPQPCMVRSMDLEYNAGTAFTFLTSISQKGYIRKPDGSRTQKAFPPVEFTYEQLGWNTEIKTLPRESLDNLPTGIDDNAWQWIDLYNEGISGILTERAGAWYYKGNSGDGQLDGMRLVASSPSLKGLSPAGLHFQDIEARGQKFLVSNQLDGYYELGDDNEWQPFRNFGSLPNIDLLDPNLKFLDLNGDGMADILISEEEVFTWYASKGKDGFESYKRTTKPFDEEKGPAIVFADSTQSVVLADMSGDGLMDIVRIRYSEVSYWPNLGYGRFGARVSMSNAPVLDSPENFHPQFIKLADLDGSGTTDMIYLGRNSFKIYFNQAGNGWTDNNIVNAVNPLPFPPTDAHSFVSVIDLMGNGTGCIVWSSPLPRYASDPLRYIDLMGGRKPHILTAYRNNMGKEVNIRYKPSTFFYLADKKAGTPWVTKLPFVVQCVGQVEMIDQVRKSRLTNQYTYHHGYFDHAEREFRGFGRVDQTDTEDFENYKKQADPGGAVQLVDEEIHQPPILTRTWYHTGAFLDKEKMFSQFAHEYYQNAAIPEKELTDPPLPPTLTVDEWREALRACKGLPLRVEIFSPDGSELAMHPYSTSHQSCLIRLLQPRVQNPYAVFAVQESESLTYTYERDPSDPRVSHNMTIKADEFGNVLAAATIAYGRKIADASLTAGEQAEQSSTHIIFSDKGFTNKVDTPVDYHLPAGHEEKTYELTGTTPGASGYFSIDEINTAFGQSADIAYLTLPAKGQLQKRLIEHVRILFLKNDMTGPLDLGILESRALPSQSFKLSMTPELRDFIFGDKINDDLLIHEGRYAHFNDGNYWIASGTHTFDPANFYQITKMSDPFGFSARIQYDPTYRFFVQSTVDELDNKAELLGFNYRTLMPWLIMDINNNRGGIRSDELGMVVGGFVMGKEEEDMGDLLDITTAEASPADQPTHKLEYDLFSYVNTGSPNFIRTDSRETHYFPNVQPDKDTAWRTAYSYMDGEGQVIMQKQQAEPGIALMENEDGTVTETDTTPNLRWVGNGRTILNNKGKPVKQYEPYFSTTPDYEDSRSLVERGVTPIIRYDPAGRVIRTDLPGGCFTKLEFSSWAQHSFDQNDTVLDSQWYKDRIIAPVPSIATPEEVAAAKKAVAHANTPTSIVLDSLGKGFLHMADNGPDGKYKTTSRSDIEGNLLDVTDAAGNIVMQFRYDMLGAQVYHLGMDGGMRWVINDVMGKPMRSFDSRDQVFRYEYDQLHRPVKIFMRRDQDPEINTEKIVYGESLADAAAKNLRGRTYQHYDGAGITTSLLVDFKGNIVQSSRQLVKGYKDNADWNQLTDAGLEATPFTTTTVFDALDRKTQVQSPDASITRMLYNEAGALNELLVSIKGSAEKSFIKDIGYDAKGRRESILYGNDRKTDYEYDLKTSRLAHLGTSSPDKPGDLQDLRYTYDPVGNISFIKDAAQPDIFFNNAQIKAENDFTYDAIYRLTSAMGREHSGQNTVNETAGNNNVRNFPFENVASSGDTQALRNYTQKYIYDGVGNILQLQHVCGAGSYTRTCRYNNNDTDRQALGIAADSVKNNQLLSTSVGAAITRYQYDAHGNMLNQPHLQAMQWNYKDQLQRADLGGGGTAFYVYDGNGQRARKVIEHLDGTRTERIYLKGFELYREINSAGAVQEETETLHIMDDTRRIALVETKTIKDGQQLVSADQDQLIRYQHGNHQGSSSLELDGDGALISYEEYHPYGTTSYTAAGKDLRAAAKRYRYTGMERDEETGMAYHGARYYLPWLGRWLSADPIGTKG